MPRRKSRRPAVPPRPAGPPSGCHCTNHLGNPKQQHRDRDAAITWVVRRGLGKNRGMRYEFYPCPTSDRWHVRTARAPRGGAR